MMVSYYLIIQPNRYSNDMYVSQLTFIHDTLNIVVNLRRSDWLK